MAITTLLYSSETWVLKKKDEQKIHTVEMKFLRSVTRCNRQDRIRNEEIRIFFNGVIKIFFQLMKVLKDTEEYEFKTSIEWKSRIPKTAKDYNPRGRRKVARPKKRWTCLLYTSRCV